MFLFDSLVSPALRSHVGPNTLVRQSVIGFSLTAVRSVLILAGSMFILTSSVSAQINSAQSLPPVNPQINVSPIPALPVYKTPSANPSTNLFRDPIENSIDKNSTDSPQSAAQSEEQTGTQSSQTQADPQSTIYSAAEPALFNVETIKVSGVTLIPQKEIDAVIDSYKNKQLTAEDLTLLVGKINSLYREKGYLTSLAFIPPQDLEKGTILVKVLEGMIGDMTVSGNKYTKSHVIARRIRQNPGEPLNLPSLEKDLAVLNRTEPYRIKARLAAGDRTGESTVNFDIEEQQPFQLSATFDNAGRPGIGTYRTGIEFLDRNVTGRNDQFFANYIVAAGQQITSASYNVPINKYGTTIGGSFGFNYVDVDLESIGIDSGAEVSGNLFDYGLLISQPLGWERNWSTDLGFNIRQASSFFDDGFIDEKTDTDVRSLTLGINYDKFDTLGRSFVRSSATFAPNWLGATDDFVKFENFATRVFALPKNNVLTLRAYTQLTSNGLPAIEQFQLGGINSVRGYSQGVLIGDRGYNVSAEWKWPVPFLSKASPWVSQRMQGVFFADYGQIFLDDDNRNFISGVSNTAENTSLLSAGVGFRAFFTQYVQGFVDLAFGLQDRRSVEPKAQPTVRVHFGLRSDLLSNAYKRRSETVTPIKTNVFRPAAVSLLRDDGSAIQASVSDPTLEPIDVLQ
ncbi:MAG: ShlB/FhaC/HecB family hemolysin secretion/activation protein [Cyanobacteria bacterium P01_H01_bin.74]